MKKEPRLMILVLPVSKFDRRNDAEAIEGVGFKNYQDLMKTLKQSDNDMAIYSLSDFMDACNDEDIYLDNKWITYVYLSE